MNCKNTIGVLQGELSRMIDTVDWNPTVTNINSTMNFVEVKSMLVYAKRKLTKIAMQEGLISREAQIKEGAVL